MEFHNVDRRIVSCLLSLALFVVWPFRVRSESHE